MQKTMRPRSDCTAIGDAHHPAPEQIKTDLGMKSLCAEFCGFSDGLFLTIFKIVILED